MRYCDWPPPASMMIRYWPLSFVVALRVTSVSMLNASMTAPATGFPVASVTVPTMMSTLLPPWASSGRTTNAASAKQQYQRARTASVETNQHVVSRCRVLRYVTWPERPVAPRPCYAGLEAKVEEKPTPSGRVEVWPPSCSCHESQILWGYRVDESRYTPGPPPPPRRPPPPPRPPRAARRSTAQQVVAGVADVVRQQGPLDVSQNRPDEVVQCSLLADRRQVEGADPREQRHHVGARLRLLHLSTSLVSESMCGCMTAALESATACSLATCAGVSASESARWSAAFAAFCRLNRTRNESTSDLRVGRRGIPATETLDLQGPRVVPDRVPDIDRQLERHAHGGRATAGVAEPLVDHVEEPVRLGVEAADRQQTCCRASRYRPTP